MGQNKGKIFETNWKASVPDNIMYYRLKDSAQAFGGSNNLRFSLKNPCDCFLFNGIYLFALELKSVGTSSISFERNKNEKKKVVHYHQIKGLMDFDKYKKVIAGFLFNFRKKDGSEILYYQHINKFNKMIDNMNKKSFNESDLVDNGAFIIDSKKLKVNYRYDIETFLHNASIDYLCIQIGKNRDDFENRRF
jgi:hypothetical protein